MKELLKCLALFASLLALSAAMATAAPQPVEERPGAKYLNVTGVIAGVERTARSAAFRVKLGEGEEIIYNVFPETPIYAMSTMEPVHSDSLKVGQNVFVAYSVDTPQLASMPPQITPEVMVLDDAEGERFAKVDIFDENWLSSDGELVLNISDETLIFDLTGTKITAADAAGKSLLVFYGITTRSEPPQTPPEKVIYLDVVVKRDAAETDGNEAEAPPEQAIAPEPEPPAKTGADVLAALKVFEYEGAKVVKLRDVAELLGYSVSWDGAARLVTITKNESYFILGVGQYEFACNDLMYAFDVAPFLVNDYTYVEERFVEDLLQMQ